MKTCSSSSRARLLNWRKCLGLATVGSSGLREKLPDEWGEPIHDCTRLRRADNERRQETNHRVRSHVDEQARVERTLHQIAAGPIELDAHHQTHAADVYDAGNSRQRVA